mmetsp:Transcript_7076/g.16531  ORF Transcript_7076/g.16531 Transcript_7076/m.16531 type:complete len:212 (-) Transcript_7076:976-1611(-)
MTDRLDSCVCGLVSWVCVPVAIESVVGRVESVRRPKHGHNLDKIVPFHTPWYTCYTNAIFLHDRLHQSTEWVAVHASDNQKQRRVDNIPCKGYIWNKHMVLHFCVTFDRHLEQGEDWYNPNETTTDKGYIQFWCRPFSNIPYIHDTVAPWPVRDIHPFPLLDRRSFCRLLLLRVDEIPPKREANPNLWVVWAHFPWPPCPRFGPCVLWISN